MLLELSSSVTHQELEPVKVAEPGRSSLTLLDRLIHTHPAWYLPSIGTAHAQLLLSDTDPGLFIVHRGHRNDVITISLHGLLSSELEQQEVISTSAGVCLQHCDKNFSSIPHLIEYFCRNYSIFSTRLRLPLSIMLATSQQQLQYLASLGEDFWQYAISKTHGQNLKKPTSSADRRGPTVVTGKVKHVCNLPDICVTSQMSEFNREIRDSKVLRSGKSDDRTNGRMTDTKKLCVVNSNKTDAKLNCDGMRSEAYFKPIAPESVSDDSVFGETDSHYSSHDGFSETSDILDRVAEELCHKEMKISSRSPKIDVDQKLNIAVVTELGTLSDQRSLEDIEMPQQQRPMLTVSPFMPLRVASCQSKCSFQLSRPKSKPYSSSLQVPDDGRRTLFKSAGDLAAALRESHQKTKSVDLLNSGLSSSPAPVRRSRQSDIKPKMDHLHENWQRRSVAEPSSRSVSCSRRIYSKTAALSAENLSTGGQFTSVCIIPDSIDLTPAKTLSSSSLNSIGPCLSDLQLSVKSASTRRTSETDTVEGRSRESLSSDVTDSACESFERSSRSKTRRLSDYDNLQNFVYDDSNRLSKPESVYTLYSPPWDSSPWDSILQAVGANHAPNYDDPTRFRESHPVSLDKGRSAPVRRPATPVRQFDSLEQPTAVRQNRENNRLTDYMRDTKKTKSLPFLATSNISETMDVGHNCSTVKVKKHILNIAEKKSTMFGLNVQHFVKCTLEGNETDPHIVLRNVRQFMNGIQNYLVQQQDSELRAIIESERLKLNSNEFLNVDAIIESVLDTCILRPLKDHIYSLFNREFRRNGSLRLMQDCIHAVKLRSLSDFGFKGLTQQLSDGRFEKIKHNVKNMYSTHSPMKKLDSLMDVIHDLRDLLRVSSSSSDITSSSSSTSVFGDDVVPLLAYVLARCNLVSVEIEAHYLRGLLHQTLLTGEAGDLVMTFVSAVHLLKNMKTGSQHRQSLGGSSATLYNTDAFLKVIIPDEKEDSIITQMIPVPPPLTTKELCRMVSHRLDITNAQDYALYVLVRGTEDKLPDTASPHAIRDQIKKNGFDSVFVFKRINAKFAWPKDLH